VQPKEHPLTDEVIIRPSNASDVPAVERLFQAHLNWINVWFQDSVTAFRTPTMTTRCIEYFPGAVAHMDGQLIGFINCRMRDPHFIDLINVYVDDPYRRQGIGTALCQSLELQARARGIRTLLATSSSRWFPGKPSARGVFENLGFEIMELNSDTDLYIKRDLPPLSLVEEEARAKSSRMTRR
jgi:GNAT superfamily N-acetyltransferase